MLNKLEKTICSYLFTLFLLLLPLTNSHADTNCGPGYPIPTRAQVASKLNSVVDPVEFVLKTNDKQTVGKVMVTNIDENETSQLLFEYQITHKKWKLASVDLMVATSLLNLPKNSDGQLDINKFSYKFHFNKLKQTFTIKVPLTNDVINGNFANVCDQSLTLTSHVILAPSSAHDHSKQKEAWMSSSKDDNTANYVEMNFPCLPCPSGSIFSPSTTAD